MWYLIENTGDKESVFTREGIPFTQVEILSPHREIGLAFPEEYKDLILQVLGISGPLFELETNRESVHLLSLNRPLPVKRVKSDFRCVHWEEYAIAIEAWVKEWVSQNLALIPTEIEEVNLSFGLTKQEAPREYSRPHRNSVFLLFVYDRWDVNSPVVDTGEALFSPGRNWFLYYNLPNSCLSRDHFLKTTSCLETLLPNTLVTDPEKIEQIRRQIAEAQKERIKANYVKLCQGSRERQLTSLRSQLEDSQAKVQEYFTRSVNLQRNIANLITQISLVENDPVSETQRLMEEFERFFQNPKIETVAIQEKIIQVHTVSLCTVPLGDGTVRELGKYQLDLSANGDIPRIYNLTRRVNGQPHPHHQGNNSICWGNITEDITRLTAQMEFVILAQVIIQFLETPNEDDSLGRRIFDWPIKKG